MRRLAYRFAIPTINANLLTKNNQQTLDQECNTEELTIEADYPVSDWIWDADSSILHPNNNSAQEFCTEPVISTPTILPSSEDHTLAPLNVNTVKRTYQDQKTNTPPHSPIRKKARPQNQSSIRRALERKEAPHGLLLYFCKATESEHQKWVNQSTIDVAERADDVRWQQETRISMMENERRQRATDRKREQRKREKNFEIARGLRSPGGRRIKV